MKNQFLQAITQTFSAYSRFGARSSKKLVPIHSWFSSVIQSKLGKRYSVMSLGHGKEFELEGKYYPKTLDITILFESKPITTLSFKFVTSNYAQNSNNYFENLLGETANIRRIGISFVHFLVLRAHTPYYDKNKGNKRGKLLKTETLSEHHLLKYVKLFKDLDFPHKPDVLGMAIIDFDEKNNAYFSNLGKLKLTKGTKQTVLKDFSVETFIKKTIALCHLKS